MCGLIIISHIKSWKNSLEASRLIKYSNQSTRASSDIMLVKLKSLPLLRMLPRFSWNILFYITLFSHNCNEILVINAASAAKYKLGTIFEKKNHSDKAVFEAIVIITNLFRPIHLIIIYIVYS